MRAKKGLGQHFLADAAAARRIVDASGVGAEDLAVEIGPGRGALTGLLAVRAGRVVGVELDAELCAFLRQRLGAGVQILHRDVRETDLPALVRAQGFDRAVLLGNLPYHITGAVVEQILAARASFRRAVLLVQREVARRMLAGPGGKDYGILSVAVQLHSRPERLFDLSPDRFRPAPKVHSSAVRLDFEAPPPVRVADERAFFRVVRTAFGQRRKMIKNTLPVLAGGDAGALARALARAGVDPRLRPEAVSIAQFEQICRGLAALESRKNQLESWKVEKLEG